MPGEEELEDEEEEEGYKWQSHGGPAIHLFHTDQHTPHRAAASSLHPDRYSPTHPPHHHHQQHHHHHHHGGSPTHLSPFQQQQQRTQVVYVDTIITDSNGNTSRYDSEEDIALTPAHHVDRLKGRRHSAGPSLTQSGTGSKLRGANSHSKLVTGASDHHVNNNNKNKKKNRAAMTSTPGSGGGRRSSVGKSAPGSGSSSPRPDSGTGKKIRTERRLSASATSPTHSDSSLMSQDAVFLHVPTVALTPDPVAPNAHHTRASSFRAPKTSNELKVDDGALANVRRNSMPNVCNNLLNVPGTSGESSEDLGDKDSRGNIRRVRSFKTTSKGVIVNRGDSFKKKSTHSLMSTGSTVTDNEARARGGNNNANGQLGYGVDEAGGVGVGAPAYFRVCMMGAAGTGKTSMVHQFLASEYVDTEDTDETHQMTVTVLLDGEESTIEFIDPPDRNVISEGLEQLLDAYVVVFAINDDESFNTAQQLVRYLRVDYGTDRAILLVANKIDLVRKRKVTAEEARLVATTFDCKYAEISAALSHHVDELLVGIITQIRLQLSIPFTTIFFPHKDAKRRKGKKALCKGPKGFFSRLFRRGSSNSAKKDKGVDNLMY